MTTPYTHLDDAVRPYAELNERERIDYIRVDRWIDYPRARRALDKLDELLLFPKRARMPNLLIFGASGMGKTMIVEKFLRAHPPSFDEVQNLIAGTYREQRRMLNLLRFLGNELRIPLVCLGSHEARDVIRGDAHLNSRFEPFGLPLWRHDAEFQGLIGGLLRSLPLRAPSELTDSAVKRLVDVNGGITAAIFRMVTGLATAAILDGTERITPAAILKERDLLSSSDVAA